MDGILSIEQLLSLGLSGSMDCADRAEPAKGAAYGIGNAWIPDHILTVFLPRKLRKQIDCKRVEVSIHIIWLETNGASRYSGLVADKKDGKLYFADVFAGDVDSSGSVRFTPASDEAVLEKADRYNPYLKDVVRLRREAPEKLWEYQVYSNLSDLFYYVELPLEDKVVLWGAGLHTDGLLDVGWVGKLKNKDFFLAYAECSLQAYGQLQAEEPSLYERGRKMELYQSRFSCYRTLFEKRKEYPALVQLLKNGKKEPAGEAGVAAFWASANGTVMQEYRGPVQGWMLDFAAECDKMRVMQ